jgi:CheY-like chemotaxis protein
MHEYNYSNLSGKHVLPATTLEKVKEADTRPGWQDVGFLGTIQTAMISKDVLVVDDDPYLCEILKDVLEAEGHTARRAANGEEALERIRERKPQLILLDLMMPGMNGWELSAVLHENPEWSDIPIVVVTAAHSITASSRPLNNTKAFIHKPFDIDAVTEAVLIYAS